MPEQIVLTSLIILDTRQGFEYASDIKHAKILNMLRYRCNDIIIIIINIVTNVIW